MTLIETVRLCSSFSFSFSLVYGICYRSMIAPTECIELDSGVQESGLFDKWETDSRHRYVPTYVPMRVYL